MVSCINEAGTEYLHREVRMFSKHTSKAVSASEVKAMRFSPAMSFGRPYSFPTASLIWHSNVSIWFPWQPILCNVDSVLHTCMLTTCPSPLFPLIVAVTKTRVPSFTKFRIHRSCPDPPWCATRSNLRAKENGRMSRRSREENKTAMVTTRAAFGRKKDVREQNNF